MTAVAHATVSADAARAIVASAAELAAGQGLAVVVAIVDASGDLKAFERMDGAALIAVDIAIDKAWTAAATGVSTHQLAELVAADTGARALADRPRVCALAGGQPIAVDDEVVGAVGVSGGSSRQDMAIAEAAIARAVPAGGGVAGSV